MVPGGHVAPRSGCPRNSRLLSLTRLYSSNYFGGPVIRGGGQLQYRVQKSKVINKIPSFNASAWARPWMRELQLVYGIDSVGGFILFANHLLAVDGRAAHDAAESTEKQIGRARS